MIYLICGRDSKQRIVEINNNETYKTNLFYKYFVENFEHKNVLYSLDFYKQIIKEIFPNRVNVIYSNDLSKEKLPNIINGIVSNNLKEIVKTYKNNIDDIYVFCSDKITLETFGRYADYLIVFSSDEIGYTLSSLPDSLNFSTFDLLRTEEQEKYRIEYYVFNSKAK